MATDRTPMTAVARLRGPLMGHGAFESLDLESAAVSLDPFPHYEALRRRGDVHFLPRHGFWIVVGYELVESAFAQPQVFSNAPYAEVDAVLLGVDPPRHATVRQIVAGQLSAHALERLRLTAGRLATEALQDSFDAVADYAQPISRGVTAELIGFDEACVADILRTAERAARAGDQVAALIGALDGNAHRSSLYEALLLNGDDALTEAQARSLVRLLWLAGTTTTQRVIAGCVLGLLEEPEAHRRLAADRGLLPRFVEEVLRLGPPEHLLRRSTTRPVHLGGVDLPEGAAVALCVSAANRDPAHFDDPSALRLDRAPKRHLAFGGGIHHCVGAAIARHVVGAALCVLLDNTTQLRASEALVDIPYFHTATALTPERLSIVL